MIEIVLLIFASLFIITQVSWWIFHYPWPNRPFCNSVNKKINGWFTNINKLWQLFEIPTFFGLLALIMIIPIFIMNISLLALVLVGIPPGNTIIIPFIGSFGIYALMAGTLFALVQVSFGLILQMRKRENSPTQGMIILIILTIVFESGMYVWRALMLTSGEQLISPTLWDQAILFGGPILSGLLGVMIPVMFISLVPYGFFDFIEQIVKDIVLFVRISLSYIALGIIWILFGFHS